MNKKMSLLEICKRIMKAMEEKNVSYGELSAATGIPKSALHRYATGETSKIPLDRIESIATALNVSAAWIMGWETDDRKAKYDLSMCTKDVESCLNLFLSLNENGRKKAIENLEDLNSISKYTENIYKIKIAARSGNFQEKTITDSEADKITNLPDVDDLK